MDLKEVLCVIPARGGSKGIPQKNLRLLGGIPLVAHSILHARMAGLPIENIILSSDDDAILECSKYGATPLWRPEEISGDGSSTESALIHAFLASEIDDFGEPLRGIKHILLLQATSPIRLPSTVKGFLKFCLDNDYDSALTVTEFHDFFWYLEDEWKSTYDPAKRPMRQSLAFRDDKFFDNGSMYFTSSEVLLTQRCRLGGKVGVYPISELEGMQIDTPRDLFLFECIFDGTISGLTGVKNAAV